MNKTTSAWARWILLMGLWGMMAVYLEAQPDPQWSKLEFLLGEWSGTGSGKPGDVIEGKSAFAFDLDKKIMVRKSRSVLAPREGEKKGAFHEDLMIISPGSVSGKWQAHYFDNEGHVIHYQGVRMENPARVVFESDGAGTGPRFRLIYTERAPQVLEVEFQISPPGVDFQLYTKGIIKKN